jgi:hypothetical protein
LFPLEVREIFLQELDDLLLLFSFSLCCLFDGMKDILDLHQVLFHWTDQGYSLEVYLLWKIDHLRKDFFKFITEDMVSNEFKLLRKR